jgi:hypothetical protein
MKRTKDVGFMRLNMDIFASKLPRPSGWNIAEGYIRLGREREGFKFGLRKEERFLPFRSSKVKSKGTLI